jgi:proline racemase
VTSGSRFDLKALCSSKPNRRRDRLTGFHQYVLDPTDPLPVGYRLGDIWKLS